MKAVTKKKTAVKRQATKKPEVSYLDKLTAPGRFFKRPDGWVRDNLLGLDWGPSSNEQMDYADAEKHCESLGGRLPELRELHSLVDYKQSNPAINKEFFGDTKTDDYYWSKTPSLRWSNCAWVVTFYSGSVGYRNKDYTHYVCPVRASQK